MNIIKSAVVNLTLWYLGLIMILSVGFSLVLYRVSSDELSRGLRRQGAYLNLSRLPAQFDTLQEFRTYQLELELAQVRRNLIFFNLLTLFLGGAASYLLARHTLHPIEEALERQSRFTADASHELRTPLTAMQTETEVALRDPKLTREQAIDLLQSNLEEVGKLRALSDGLLRLAHQNGNDLPQEQINLEHVVAAAVSRVSKSAEHKKVKLQVNTANAAIRGDLESLTELVVILLDNAIKYSSPNTAVTIKALRQGRVASVIISDQGIGIKASDLPHIFDRFYRADSSRSKLQVDGYGLGLSIAQQIVQLHQGSIDAKSTPNLGTTFTVKFPAV